MKVLQKIMKTPPGTDNSETLTRLNYWRSGQAKFNPGMQAFLLMLERLQPAIAIRIVGLDVPEYSLKNILKGLRARE